MGWWRPAGAGLLLASLVAGAGSPALGCPAGLDVGGVLEGDLGAAPVGGFEEIGCVEITNDLSFDRREVAWSGVPVPRALGLLTADGLVVVGPGERRLAAQLDVLARWGGPVDDPGLPIRWLEVAVPARVGGGGTAVYSLRRYASPPAPVDPFADSVAAAGGRWTVDTGLATFTIDPASPALLDEISIDLDDDGAGRTTVYRHAPGAGPRLVLPGAGGADLGAMELDPRAPYPHTLLAWVHWEEEDRDQAVAELERAVEVTEGSGRSRLNLAWAYAQTGRRDEARALVEEAITGPGAELLSPVLVAGARHALGDTEEARALLERALAAGDDRLLGWLVTRLLTGVRADPAFADLPARIGLPEPAGPAAGRLSGLGRSRERKALGSASAAS